MTPQEFRSALRAIGLSQRALAERLGLAISTVNRWAVGPTPVPRYAIAYLDVVGKLRALAAFATEEPITQLRTKMSER
jgi:transcriptional regulator with XRE-family HTH domain